MYNTPEQHVRDHVRATSHRKPFSPWKQHLPVLPQFVWERRRWPPRISSSVPGYDPYHRGTSCSAQLLLHMWSLVERRTRLSRLQRMRWLFPSTTVSTLRRTLPHLVETRPYYVPRQW